MQCNRKIQHVLGWSIKMCGSVLKYGSETCSSSFQNHGYLLHLQQIQSVCCSACRHQNH